MRSLAGRFRGRRRRRWLRSRQSRQLGCPCPRPTRHNITTTKSNPTCPYQHKHPRDPHPERLNHSRTTPPGLNPKSIRMTTTIGMSYEDLRPQAVRPKKSFFQRLNDTHDQLISHMRSLKEDPVLSVKQGERTRASSTTSLTSTPRTPLALLRSTTKTGSQVASCPHHSHQLRAASSLSSSSFCPGTESPARSSFKACKATYTGNRLLTSRPSAFPFLHRERHKPRTRGAPPGAQRARCLTSKWTTGSTAPWTRKCIATARFQPRGWRARMSRKRMRR